MKVLLTSAATLIAFTSPIGAQQSPPIRQLGAVTATARETFNGQIFVRHSSQGVFVNDVAGRRLLMFDPVLSKATVIADTTPATANAYSGRTGGLIAYRGDSTLFVDAQSMSMLVIDPAGKVARVISVPRSQDAMVLGNPTVGTPAFDGQGRLVYRPIPLPDRARMMQGMGGGGGPGGQPGAFGPPQLPESAAVVAVDLGTRKVDTIAFTAIPRMKMDIQRDDHGRVTVSAVTNPLPVVDDWAVLADGSIAIVRGRDYRIDWIRADGSRESSPKMPFEWKRLSDEDKVAFLDSVKAARERMATQAAANGQSQQVVVGGAPAGGADGPAGGGRQVPPREGMIIVGGGPGGPGGGGPGMQMGRNPISLVQPSELPDYYPPFFAGSSRADADGNLWIRTTTGTATGFVYDVVNAKGQLIDRVQAPKDRTIVGFGPGGVVYLAHREGSVTKLEKATYAK